MVRELRGDREIQDAFALMAQLRDRIREDSFLADVRRQQVQGYRLFGLFDEGRLLALAGVRRSCTLSRGEHLFVDDLVTAQDARGRGHGTALLRWLAAMARDDGIRRVYLDSRVTAKGFYEQAGFTFSSSIPCWVEVETLLADAG